MQTSNLDRKLAVFFLAIVMIVIVAMALVTGRTERALWMGGMFLILFWSTVRWNKTGWCAQYKWAGDKIEYYTDEGLFLVPWFLGFTHIKNDCRDITTHLDEMQVFTKDKTQVSIRRSKIVWKIVHLGLFHNLAAEKGVTVEGLLDDVFDQEVRQCIKGNNLKDVLGMDFSKKGGSQPLKRWGIEIVEIIVPEVAPTDPAVLEALQLKATEVFEREAQKEEAEGVIERIAQFMLTGNFTKEQAIEEAQLTAKQAGKNIDVKKILMDPTATAALEALLGGRK